MRSRVDREVVQPPFSSDGGGAILPAPPWHYSSDLLVVEYRADPAAVAALLPPELEPMDGGLVAAAWGDWQSCGADQAELVDPVIAQYREFYILLGATYRGVPVNRCAYIWVDNDQAIYRGMVQGFAKRFGSIHLTRLHELGLATPHLEPGARFGASAAAHDRLLARATITLREEVDGPGTVYGTPSINHRFFQARDASGPVVDELVYGTKDGFQRSQVWAGDAQLTFGSDTLEDLAALASVEVLSGYRFSTAYTYTGSQPLETLAR